MGYDRLDSLQRSNDPIEIAHYFEEIQDRIEETVDPGPGEGLVISGTQTFDINQAFTIVIDSRVVEGMRVWVQANTSSSSDDALWVDTIQNGSFVIHHSNTAEPNKRVFWFAV